MSNCPSCDTEGCYNSGFTVECISPECVHFSVKQCTDFIQAYFRERLLTSFIVGQDVGPIDLPLGFFVCNHVHDSIIVTVPFNDNQDLVHKIQF